ncbi:ankyrin repeat-containing [Anaeramoeba flamelloides]|uniref:Ankyrin repeat-containing n=1 Tax=Anaeramoeba flamelloides TaxID=1746091 RepID=A0AAV7ZY27_9EUKA|nr:ankyrin repeat-containing [Anaeramoeba flamelloides]
MEKQLASELITDLLHKELDEIRLIIDESNINSFGYRPPTIGSGTESDSSFGNGSVSSDFTSSSEEERSNGDYVYFSSDSSFEEGSGFISDEMTKGEFNSSDLEIRNEQYTPLHFVCKLRSDLEIMKYLLEKGSKVNIKTTKKKSTPLHLLVSSHGGIEKIKYLISKGSNVNAKTIHSVTPTHLLFQKYEITNEIFDLVLKSKGDLQLESHGAMNCLHYYCQNEQFKSDIVLRFEKDEINWNKNSAWNNNTPLHYACQNLSVTPQILESLLKIGCDPTVANEKKETPLHLLCRNRNINYKLIETIVKHYPNLVGEIDKFGFSCFHHFAVSCSGSIKILTFLQGEGLDINAKSLNQTIPLHMVCDNKRVTPRVLNNYIKLGADPRIYNSFENCLHLIVRNPNFQPECFKILTNNGAEHSYNRKGFTPLHILASDNINGITVDLIEFCFQNEISFRRTDSFGNSIFHTICANKDTKDIVIQKIVELDPQIVNLSTPKSPLSEIISNGNGSFHLMKFILPKMHLQQLTSKILSPLNYLVMGKYISIEKIRYLLENGFWLNHDWNLNGNPFTQMLKNEFCTQKIFKFVIQKGLDYTIITANEIYKKLFRKVANTNSKKNIMEGLKIIEYFANYVNTTEITCSFKDSKNSLVKSICEQFVSSNRSFYEDIYELYKSQFLADSEILGYKVHSLIIKKRSGLTVEEINNKIKNSDKILIKEFIEELYGKSPISESRSQEIAGLLGIKNFQQRIYKRGFKELYNDHSSKDFFIISKKIKIAVHKIILTTRSGLYKIMFQGLQENLNEVHDYSSNSPETLKLLIKFLYTDKIKLEELNDKIYEELKEAVTYYQLNEDSFLNYYLKKYEIYKYRFFEK